MKVLNALKTWFSKLPERKRHLDFLAAFLSIPVLVTVITINLNNLKDKREREPVKEEKQIIVQTNPNVSIPDKEVLSSKDNKNETSVTQASCKKEIGPISISYPKEEDSITDNPVCVIIKYEDPSYCSVVWSYRTNNGPWSEYDSNSVCLYNLPKGDVKFDLKIQSTVSQKQSSLERKFVYEGQIMSPSPSDSKVGTQSSSLAQ